MTIWYLFLVRTLHATMHTIVSQYANAKVYENCLQRSCAKIP